MDQFDSDEIVADGAAYQRPAHFPFHKFEDSHFITSTSADTINISAHSTHLLDPSCTRKSGPATAIPPHFQSQVKSNSDSGFLSGLSISEEPSSGLDPTSDLATQYSNMKISNTSSQNYFDSGLDVGYSQLNQKTPDTPFHSSHSDLNNLDSQSSPSGLHSQTRPITFEDLLRQDEDGDTPLHLAVLQGFIEVVFSLVRIFPDPWFLEVPNKRMQTSLHLAVLTNQAPLVRRLVVGGASVQSRDRNGNTPLHLACRDGHVDCVKALCMPVSQEERQAALLHHDIPPQPLPQDLEQRNYDGQMPLHLAVMNGHLQVVKLLCYFGANVNAIEGKNGRTALHYAVERRWPAVLHYLVVQCGAKIEAETYCGYSAYQLATVAAPMLAVLLIQLGARARPMPHESQNSSETEDSDLESDIPTWRPNKEQGLAMFHGALHMTT